MVAILRITPRLNPNPIHNRSDMILTREQGGGMIQVDFILMYGLLFRLYRSLGFVGGSLGKIGACRTLFPDEGVDSRLMNHNVETVGECGNCLQPGTMSG